MTDIAIDCLVCNGYCNRDGETGGCGFCKGEGMHYIPQECLNSLEDEANEFLKERAGSVFHIEIKEIAKAATSSFEQILLSPDRINKHPPYTWEDEDEDEHLNKAIRHILTYQLIRDGHQNPTGEAHLNNAITRLAMAIAKKDEKEDGRRETDS